MSKKWLPPEAFAATLPHATVFGDAFFTDEDDRPVQLRATYSSAHPWQWPGGLAEPGERPWETAVRECREETGIHLAGPTKLLTTVFGLPGKGWPLATVGLVFGEGRLAPGQLTGSVLDPDEHDQVRALTVPEWQGLMPGRDHTRLEAVMAARHAGVPAHFDTWEGEA
ncbi:NUDIX hydrolase [Streptomyces sp. NBC_00273]|uniref:NUDIX hydrolase n=1 Tax=Streptomyces sp. NBC_00273 TaxID=2903644 RepID=UPI002E2A4550|nr:NUDIX hydrolase [Streptomyces sp. NBC_00273]